MAVPKKRKSHAATRKHRSHDALTTKPTINCPQCQQAMRPHTVCACGFYRGTEVFKSEQAQG